MNNSTNRHADLVRLLQALHLPLMAERCTEIAVKATKDNLSLEGFLFELARLEEEGRTQRRIARHLAESGLPREKTFATFQSERLSPALRLQLEHLQTGEFVTQASNIVAVGPPGVGKSHALAAVGHALIQQGYRVLWTTTATLMQRLLAAKRDLRLPQELARLDRMHCVILDDIGYVQQSQEEMEVLFTLLAGRYERRSLAITTNLVFSQWEQIFKSPLTTLAAVDRVVHHAVILDMGGVPSYRAQHAHEQQRHHQSSVSSPSST
jgi:DNA replication protein DnaC